MMNSVILTTLARGLMSLLLMYSLYLLLRGHNEPGGGFIGGLVAATAFALAAKGLGIAAARRLLHFEPQNIAMTGVGVALASGMVAWFFDDPFLTGQWGHIGSEDAGFSISSVLMFDVGVYLVVVGSVLTFFFALEEAVD